MWWAQEGKKHYSGGFAEGVLEGQGTQFYEGGTQAMYSGAWKGGQPHGQGTYYDHDGRLVYEGMYVCGFGDFSYVSACSVWTRRLRACTFTGSRYHTATDVSAL